MAGNGEVKRPVVRSDEVEALIERLITDGRQRGADLKGYVPGRIYADRTFGTVRDFDEITRRHLQKGLQASIARSQRAGAYDAPAPRGGGVDLRAVTKRFGDFIAVDDISLSLPDGQLTALLGPSGGGKSTLLRIIAGLEEPDLGTVSIGGVEVTHLPAERRNVGFVFQHYAPFRHMTVAQNVAFGLEIRKRSKDEITRHVDELLRLVHLQQFSRLLPSQLSGGQLQRMALARALAVEPRVLLLDEPFGALDANVRKELREWLRRLHDEVHVTTVLVTHDQEEAMEVADEIVLINEGRVEQIGSPDDLYDNPANDFVMRFLGEVTYLEGHAMRPHELDIYTSRIMSGATLGTISRMLRVGFGVRVTVLTDAGEEVDVLLTKARAEALGLEEGMTVGVSPTASDSRTQGEHSLGHRYGGGVA